MLHIGSNHCQPRLTCKVRLLSYSSQGTKLPNYKLKLSALQLFCVVEPLLYFYKCHVTPFQIYSREPRWVCFGILKMVSARKIGECHRASTLLLLITKRLPRNGGMTENHGAPEAGQLPRAWARGRRETESRQSMSGAKSR